MIRLKSRKRNSLFKLKGKEGLASFILVVKHNNFMRKPLDERKGRRLKFWGICALGLPTQPMAYLYVVISGDTKDKINCL